MESQGTETISHVQRWQLPAEGTVKVNVDGAYLGGDPSPDEEDGVSLYVMRRVLSGDQNWVNQSCSQCASD
jgi:hypothetical protein